VPECEILVANTPVRAFIRNRDFFKIPQVIETGADHGMWTFDRYRRWMKEREDWVTNVAQEDAPDESPAVSSEKQSLPPLKSAPESPPASKGTSPVRSNEGRTSGPIEIEPVEGGLEGVIKELEKPE
jgi:hypothetical protein